MKIMVEDEGEKFEKGILKDRRLKFQLLVRAETGSGQLCILSANNLVRYEVERENKWRKGGLALTVAGSTCANIEGCQKIDLTSFYEQNGTLLPRGDNKKIFLHEK